MGAEAQFRLVRQKERLEDLKNEMKQIGHDIQEALKNDNQEKASRLYVEHYRMAREYFITEQEIKNLEFICGD